MTDQYRYDSKARRPSAILDAPYFDDVINGARRREQPVTRDGQPTGANLQFRHPGRVVFAIIFLIFVLSRGHLGDLVNWLLAFLN